MDGAASFAHCYSNLCKVNLLRLTLCSLIVGCDWSTSHLPSKVAPSGTQYRRVCWLSLLALGIQASGISFPLYYPRWCGLRLVRQCLISALFRNLKSRTFTAEFWSSLCSQLSLFFKLHIKLMRKVFYPKIYRHTLYNWKTIAHQCYPQCTWSNLTNSTLGETLSRCKAIGSHNEMLALQFVW